MANQNYEIEKHTVDTVLSWIKTKEVVIPEIQRPFVWKATQVRDLIDSLYKGYPVGYLIVSRSHEMRLKDGSMSKGQRILIDGQQRVTALMAAILGRSVLNNEYKEKYIKIAYNPFAEGDENLFEVQDQSHLRSKKWIDDISVFFGDDFDDYEFIENYCRENPEMDIRTLNKKIKRIVDIKTKDLGIIEISSELDIDTVTDIFIRINSKGAVLSQADFAMSKIAADEKYGGNILRKAIDYFCHVAVEPVFYDTLLKNDSQFISSELGKEMAWLRNDTDSIYDPSYEDMLRVSFIHMFSRGKLKDLVSLLSGRDFETRDYKEEIAEITKKESELIGRLEGIKLRDLSEKDFKPIDVFDSTKVDKFLSSILIKGKVVEFKFYNGVVVKQLITMTRVYEKDDKKLREIYGESYDEI